MSSKQVFDSLPVSDQRRHVLNRKLTSRARRPHWRSLARVVDSLYGILQKERADILFVGSIRYFHLIRSAAKQGSVIYAARGIADRIKCIKQWIPFIPVNAWNMALTQAYLQENTEERARQIEQVVQSIAEALYLLQLKGVVVFGFGFLDRAIALGAKKLGLPVISIPHGFYAKNVFSPEYPPGGFTDYWFVWGRYFKDLCAVESLFPSDKIFVLGYPGKIETKIAQKKWKNSNKLTVCFLGQPFERHDEKLWQPKAEIVRNILNVCQKMNLPLYYRPHPHEDRKLARSIHPELVLTPENESLEASFRRYHAFFGISTTSLFEAALFGNLSVTLKSEAFDSIYLGDMGGTYAVQSNTDAIFEFLTQLVNGQLKPKPVSPEFIFVPNNTGQVFWQNIRQVLASRSLSRV